MFLKPPSLPIPKNSTSSADQFLFHYVTTGYKDVTTQAALDEAWQVKHKTKIDEK